jgi:SAM-dependent methyltransferase
MNVESVPVPFHVKLSERKAAIRDWADRAAPLRDDWITRNAFYYDDDRRYMRFLIPEGLRVLELGCATGRLLADLKPSYGVGVDLSHEMVAIARAKYPHLHFFVGDAEDPPTLRSLGGPFDVVVLSDTIGLLEDCESTLRHIHLLCTRETRVVIAYYNRLWGPILRLAAAVGAKMPSQPGHNWLSSNDIQGLLYLADFEPIKREWRQLVPKRLLGLGHIVNRLLGNLPVIRRACLRHYIVARPMRTVALGPLSTSVVVPCRNERGNIETLVRRTPRFCEDLEILFVEGHSKDGTLEEIHRVMAAHPDLDIKVHTQDGEGKGDAVRKGFTCARGQVVMILDADMTTPPETLPKFYNALIEGKGNFINGSRLVYPTEGQAMRALNFLANRGFAVLFSWLLNQRFTDTLCGTKALTKAHYERIAANRSYFGHLDPFGDFDLIFGAAKLNLKIVEVPIRYTERLYGETQISRFRHGWLLFRMAVVAYRKLKAF